MDRKGDLCSYARPEKWEAAGGDSGRATRLRALHESLDVRLYTPGNAAGRGLAIPVIPRGLGEMAVFDRDLAASTAASALAGMMGYGKTRRDQGCLAILKRAIETLGTFPSQDEPDLKDLVAFIDGRDPDLMNAIGRLDSKLLDKLVQDLEALRINRESLFGAGCEPLDAAALFGLGSGVEPGKTRLTVISTKFLGERQDVQFWVAQLLLDIARWSSRSPSDRLQAVLMLDEADIYLPAASQPATKQPVESLLKRARSAGLGLFLATQSPGDLDYKCRDNIRTWLVGIVKEPTALKKLDPMFAEARSDTTRLSGQKIGEFHLLAEGSVLGIRADRNLIPADQVPDDEILRLAASS